MAAGGVSAAITRNEEQWERSWGKMRSHGAGGATREVLLEVLMVDTKRETTSDRPPPSS